MEIRRTTDFRGFTEILSRCYPVMGLTTEEDKQNAAEHREKMEKYENVSHYGVYENEQLLGGFIHYAFPMNVYGQTIPSSGIGTLAVDLPYKKRGIAKHIITHVIKEANEQGFPLVQLYPFRPDFYRKMGFGSGPQLHVYRFSPEQAPYQEGIDSVVPLNSSHVEEIKKVYHDWAQDTHGASDKQDYEFRYISAEHTHTIGYRENGHLKGYLVYEMKHETDFHQELKVIDWFTLTNEAFHAFMNFFHLQKDQVDVVTFPSFDEDFGFFLKDPRYQSDRMIHRLYHKTQESGTGLMYRISDLRLFMNYIYDHSFGQAKVPIHFKVNDSLLNEQQSYWYSFRNGQASETASDTAGAVTLSIDIAELSSLLMGCISLEKLLDYKKAELTGHEQGIKQAIKLFTSPEKPASWSFF
ncbi:enhanced intracellular survival protein Eis [Halobacillus sp. Marseille-Q1614]|uniref:GNAT family N-acetyltransferase n=1 Tax=Halobacillus sp. Marseille-Q1614 TaxID=2709134 RepID=UPI00156DB930|nr:GNAT family N-acetyltransferase [Halobacillus sp. Marseille-Q1614]